MLQPEGVIITVFVISPNGVVSVTRVLVASTPIVDTVVVIVAPTLALDGHNELILGTVLVTIKSATMKINFEYEFACNVVGPVGIEYCEVLNVAEKL